MHIHPHPLQAYWSMLLAGFQADVLKTALDLGIFDVVGEQKLSAGDIAIAIRRNATGLGHVLELLVSMQLLGRSLQREGAVSVVVYNNTRTSRDCLCRGAPLYCADALIFRLNALRQLGSGLNQLLVKEERAAEFQADAFCNTDAGLQWALAARMQLDQEQIAVTVPMAMWIFENMLPLTEVRRFADFGGSAGHVAIAMAKKYPLACGEVIDLAEPVKVARKNIERAGLADRLSVRVAELNGGSLPESRYDLLWCSSVLHFVPDVRNTLHEIYASLVPGGLFVSVHAEIPENPLEALPVRSYYLSLQLRNHHVGTEGTLSRQLQSAGFELLHSRWCSGFSMTPLQVHVARKIA